MIEQLKTTIGATSYKIGIIKKPWFQWKRNRSHISNSFCLYAWIKTYKCPRFRTYYLTWFKVYINLQQIQTAETTLSYIAADAKQKTVFHYSDVIMGTMASRTTNLTIVYSTVYSGADQKKTSKLRVSGLCERNSSVTGEFPAQRASNVENVSIWWRHHVTQPCTTVFT